MKLGEIMKNKRNVKLNLICFLIAMMYMSILVADNKDEQIPTITIHAIESSLPSVLSILADESGYNIVTGPNVNSSEKITIHLDDAPIDQAIDMVVRAAGLSYEFMGNSILVAERDRLDSDVGVVPHVIPLKYANATEIAQLLTNVTNKITIDNTTNSKSTKTKSIIWTIRNGAIFHM